MIVVANRFEVAEEYEEEFVERFSADLEELAAQDGFVRFELLAPEDHPHGGTDVHVAKTYWESREAFRAWTESDHFERAHSRETPDGMFEADNELELHSVVVERTAD